MYSVAQVLSREFGRSWHECVAIVQEAASLLQPGLTLPDPDDLQFDENGALSFGFGSESSQEPVVALAKLLESLLEGVEAPAGLRDIVTENTGSSPAHTTVTGFSQALAFYERPNRANDLRAISDRLRGFREKSTADQEFERLREKVSGAKESDVAQKATKKKAKKAARPHVRLTRRQQQVITAGIAAGVFIGLSSVMLNRNPGFSVRGAVARVDEGMTQVVTAGLDRLGIATASAAPAADEPVEKATVGRGRSSPARTSSGRGSPDPRAEPRRNAASSSASSTPDKTIAPSRPDGTVTNSEAPAGTTTSARLALEVPLVDTLPVPPPEPASYEPLAPFYTSEDEGVSPPVLLRPQMPREPRPGEDTGYFDLLVDEIGHVEQVRLVSPRRRFHDRMLVAAAKAWKFRPATLDGQPVKYQIRVHIILPAMPGG